jgi:hypothetical protein
MDMQLLQKEYAEDRMEEYDTLPKEIRDIIKEYDGEYWGQDANEFLAECQQYREKEQQYRLTSFM